MNRRFSALVAAALLSTAFLASPAHAAQAASQLDVTPAGGYYASGPAGGWFWPSVQVYTLRNTGTAPLLLSSTADQPWVSALLNNATINPGESWGDPITINSQANTLAPGTYTSTVTFTNATSGAGSTTRIVALIVGAGGDTTLPVVTITNPAGSTVNVSSTPITISGTASDNVGVTSMYWVNMQTNESFSMPGVSPWSFSVNLVPGDNQIYVQAWDSSGNQGTTSVVVHYGAPAGQMDVTPASGFTATGPVGGPFNPPQQVYTVTNTGTAPLSFTATATQPWVSVFAGSATLPAGSSWGVVVSFTGSANALSAGTHSDTVTFTNTTNGSGNTTRPVSLVVGAAGDATPPSIAIVNPAPPTATSSSSPVTISGMASDNVGVASISWTNLQAGLSGTIPGATSWSVPVPLVSGINQVTFTAWDAGGNSSSATITVTFTGSAAAGGGGSGGGHHKHHFCGGSVPAGGSGPLLTLGALLLGLSFMRRRPLR